MRRQSAAVVAILLMLAGLGLGGGQKTSSAIRSFSLEDIMSAPFPSELVASPSGRRAAWVLKEQGRRNIWLAVAPDFVAKKVTPFLEDDGQQLSSLEFSSDESAILLVRGGSANRAGEYPNPTSGPQGVEQAVWALDLATGQIRRIGEGNDPVPNPSRREVIYLLRGRIYRCSLDKESKPEVLFKARGACSSPVFSPDGRRLAFVSGREDHSFIGVFDLAAEKILWISPSVDRDAAPAWSPDGKRIAFLRFSGQPVPLFSSNGQAFSIMVAEAETGEAREIWRCPDESGGFAQSYAARPLQWAAGDVLVFYSEHEGWMHLYGLALDSGRARCLTPGEFEVEDSSLSPDGRTVIFNSNQEDIDRRHLWSVPVSGSTAKLLTPGGGIEWSPAWLEGGQAILFFGSDAFKPGRPALVKPDGQSRRWLDGEVLPRSFPQGGLVEPQQVVYKASDGTDIHAQLFLPEGAGVGGRRPAVLFMHGGPIRQMLLGWHMREYYHNAYAFNQYLCRRGYVVLSVNFRSGIGYGARFRNAPNQGPRGASEYQDIVAGAVWLQGRPEVDPRRIGLWGGSYGGYLTALGLARDSSLFAAGVDLHGVHDWAARGRRTSGGGWGPEGEEALRLAYDSSPVADISFWTSPVLFIHGDDDRNVDFNQTTDLVQRLKKLGRAPVEVLVFPDEVHDFLLHHRWLEAFTAAADFFDRFLKK
jgi:dipeptidyl aminopeptidase/acylaminoacyl peptidase